MDQGESSLVNLFYQIERAQGQFLPKRLGIDGLQAAQHVAIVVSLLGPPRLLRHQRRDARCQLLAPKRSIQILCRLVPRQSCD